MPIFRQNIIFFIKLTKVLEVANFRFLTLTSFDVYIIGVSRHNAGLLPESLIWSYVVQLSAALRTIHAHGLACRVMDPSKILLTDKSR